jgi:methionine synthase II (cobalamin-independent)
VTGERRAGVHLVGSVPLDDGERVFRTVSSVLAPYLRRLPDGETGERRRWIWFQRQMLERHPDMEIDPTVPLFALRQWDGTLLRETPLLRFRAGVAPERVVFETGYAEAARASFDVFRRLQADGVIPDGVRFQVCLPTPMASAYMYVSPNAREAYIPAYERALRHALDAVVASIPAERLAIQWDVCQEVLILENFFPDRPADYEQQIVDELTRLGEAVPATIEMGYHLCYGSPADEHLVMPRDMAIMVHLANRVRQTLRRRVDFLHMPVPKARTDAAYVKPLADLRGYDETKLYLGLIHYDDHAGDQARIRTARGVVSSFGVASECGWGRTDPQRVAGLLESHRLAVETLER